MAQIEVAASAVIATPPERLWELVSDPSRYAEWVAGTAAVTRTDGPAREGSTYDEINPIVGPWRTKTRWTANEFDPPRRQVHRSEDVPLASGFLVIIDLAPSGDATEVTFMLRANSSALGAGVLRLLTSQRRKDNKRTIRNIAELGARGL